MPDLPGNTNTDLDFEFFFGSPVDPIINQPTMEVEPQRAIATPIDVVAVDTVAGQTIQTTNKKNGGIPTRINPIIIGLTIVGIILMFGKK